MTQIDDSVQSREQFRCTVRQFTEERLRPRIREFEDRGSIDKTLFKEMGQLGLLGLRYDPAYGGAGLDWTWSAVMHEELGRSGGAGTTLAISVHTEMATPSLAQFGSEALKRRYLVPAISGDRVAAVAVTEPDAGSDVSRIKTRAVHDGDDWVINGSKTYIANAAIADWLCLLAVTDPKAEYKGYSQIVVPTNLPGVSCQLLRKVGLNDSDTGQFFFEDVRVPITNTIGQEGQGFQQQTMQFQDERLVVCITALALVELIWEETRRWNSERVLFGERLADMQVTKFKMAEMYTKMRAAKELNNACVRALSKGQDGTELITMAKLFSLNVAHEVADKCMQLHGGFGFMKDCMAGRAFVDLRSARIGGGSDETMLHSLAQSLGL